MTFFFTPHAYERARERYGLDLTIRELSDIARACATGRAPVLRDQEDGRAFRWTARGLPVYPFVSRDGVIITFLPSDFFTASSMKAHRIERLRQAPMPPKRGKVDTCRPYKRERITIKSLSGEIE